MAVGGLVAIPELQAEGPARLRGQKPGFLDLTFLGTGAQMTAEARTVVRYCLFPGTRIRFELGEEELTGVIGAAAPSTDRATGLISYPVVTGDNEIQVREDAIIAVPPPNGPGEQLSTVAFHEARPRFARAGTPMPPEPWGPQTFGAREALLAARDLSWSRTGGVVALAGARVRPLPHQLLVAQRVLADRQVRFLLADEVGLGKTIEAGLIMQSLLAMRPQMRVLVVAPGALISQWFVELYVKFGGRKFLMLDSERCASYAGNPWDEQFVIASSRTLEELKAKDSLRFATTRWDLVIVDECHRMQPGGPLYKRIAALSKQTPHVLLLSATPGRQHADAYLALLHLLQPEAYPLDDHDGFAAKLAAGDSVSELLRATLEAEDPKKLKAKWRKAVGKDEQLEDCLASCAADDAGARDALVAYVREHYQLDHRVIRNRRQVLARLAQATGIEGVALATRSREWTRYKPDKAESTVRAALAAYREHLVAAHAVKGELPPRLMHWLLQCELAASAHPRMLDRLLAMRAAVVEEPEEFEEYRARIHPSETLAQVLRGDLSEAETTVHIALSASCFADDPDEAAVLDDLRSAVSAWCKREPARTKALVKALQQFWEEFPEEKVLVFTGHALAVEPIAELLAKNIGDRHITTFGAHQETEEREEAARRFRDERDCWVMVSDALGGEGRNFQFVSVVAHHDLPWSVAAVEQRIGRVDRIGRDGDVVSWVMRGDDDDLDAAWAEVLDDAVGVFAGSSSGLEFVCNRLEGDALNHGLRGGGSGLREARDALIAMIEGERDDRDEREAELYAATEATFKIAAEQAEAVARHDAPVDAICRWLRGIGGGVKRDDDGPRAFKLRPRSSNEWLEGVFDRDNALRHEQLQYFALGHELVDALIDDAAAASWCRASAWRRPPAPGGPIKRWEGVRACFEFELDLTPLVAAGLSLDCLRRIYTLAPPERPVHFLRADGEIEDGEDALAVLRPRFNPHRGDTTISPKTSRETWMRPLLGGKADQVTTWQERMRGCVERATTLAEELRAEQVAAALAILEPALRAQAAVVAAQAASAAYRLGDRHPDSERLAAEADEEQAEVDALLTAVSGAQVRVASLAYITIA